MWLKRKMSKKVFRQLARKNVKKSAKDYFIYFFTLTFAVCLFYMFNSIGAQFEAFQIPDTLNYLSAAQGAMVGISVIVCGIIGFLVVYANRFMMKRRKREFGIYSVLGMENKDIRKILMKENILIGSTSLISGIALGILASQALTMITGKIAGIALTGFTFVFSINSLIAAVLFFGVTFFFVHLFNIREMKKLKLIDLIYAEKKNEEMAEGKKRSSLMLLFGLLLIVAGYGVIFLWSGKEFFKSMGLGSVIIGAGTLLLFLSFAGVMIGFLKKRKSFYYRKLNLFVVNQLGSRMKSAGASIAVVCFLMYMSVSIMGVRMGMGQSAISIKDKAAPYDVSITEYYDGRLPEDEVRAKGIKNVLTEQNSKVVPLLGETAEITFYQLKDLRMKELFGESLKDEPDVRKVMGKSPVWVVGVDDYNNVTAIQGKEPVTLGKDEYAIAYDMPEAREMLKTYERHHKSPVEVGGTPLTMKKGGLYKATLNDRNVLINPGMLIVPQELAEKSEPYMSVLNGMFSGDKKAGYDAYVDDMAKIKEFDYVSQKDVQVEIISNKLISSYIGSYLGITFLVTAGAVLALQQLSQSADNKKRYALLYKMGAGDSAMKGSLLTQMVIYFGLPFGIAAVHSGVIMGGMYRHIQYLSAGDVARNILLAAGLAVILYSVYFITTYSGSKRILKL